MAARRSPGSSSALSFASDDEGAGPSSPSTISDNDESAVDPAMPPTKKRKTNARAARAISPQPGDSPTMQIDPDTLPPDLSDISSDTSDSVPPSPRPHPAGQPTIIDEAALGTEQVRVCAWDGCNVGDMGDQDRLIAHINDVHIGQKGPKAKYPCEWIDCKTKGKQHGSAYSLRNHMKSHTKERAHYCSLPECDRSFTRSDALHKHMRTVHESESFRTAEHYPKQKSQHASAAAAPASPISATSYSRPQSAAGAGFASDDPKNASSTTKITLKLGAGKDETKEPLSPASRAEMCPFSAEDGFSAEEAAMPRDFLLRLLRRQIQWAEEDQDMLDREVAEAESRREREWLEKELLLENVIEAEVMCGLDKGTMKRDGWIQGQRRPMDDEDLDIAVALPLHGGAAPWYRNAGHLRKPRGSEELMEAPPAPEDIGPLGLAKRRSSEQMDGGNDGNDGGNDDGDMDIDAD